jgi:ABC-type transport system involved in multi-copper enzyme maturation permease subunit
MGDDPKLAKDSVLAVMLLAGLFGAVLCASASLAREIRAGTALAVLAKPVGRAQFLLAKYAGLAAALALLTYVNLLAALLSSRMAYDAYGDTDWLALWIFYGAIALAYAMGGFANYFLRRPFVSDAVLSLVLMTTFAFIVINFLDKEAKPQAFAADIDWRMAQAGILILLALLVLAALALVCSTRLEIISTLAICSGAFLIGLMSDYLLSGRAKEGSWWASILYTLIPNWQNFWVADALVEGKKIPWSYVGKSMGYAAAYVGAALMAGLYLFEDRELS